MRAVTGADQIICSMYLCRSVPLQRSRCGGDERDTKEGSCARLLTRVFSGLSWPQCCARQQCCARCAFTPVDLRTLACAFCDDAR